MLNEFDLDFEELESILYSQVYHSQVEDATPICTASANPATNQRTIRCVDTLSKVSVELETTNSTNTFSQNTQNNLQEGVIEVFSRKTPSTFPVSNSGYNVFTLGVSGISDSDEMSGLRVKVPGRAKLSSASYPRKRYFQHHATRKHETLATKMYNDLEINQNIMPQAQEVGHNTIQNNITVNHYSLPEIFVNNRLLLLSDPGLTKREKSKQKQILNKKKLNLARNARRKVRKSQRLAEKELRRKKYMKPVEVVCLSDSEDGIEIIPKEASSAEKSNQGVCAINLKNNIQTVGTSACTIQNGSQKEDDDDDVIYIEPPPIEVINIDVDSDVNKDLPNDAKGGDSCILIQDDATKKISSSKPITPASDNRLKKSLDSVIASEVSGSNDFLEATIELNQNNFNMSLHGSDFNNGEFVKPAKPTETFETESSCSTSTTDFNKDLSMALKNGVFSEVEFPREDLFNENNLETFGKYITPNRKKKQKSTSNKTEEIVLKSGTSSESCSDDENELAIEDIQSKNLKLTEGKRKLPNLFPMDSDGKSLFKGQSNKLTLAEQNAKFSSSVGKKEHKRKSDAHPLSNSENELVNKKNKKKKKKHQTMNETAIENQADRSCGIENKLTDTLAGDSGEICHLGENTECNKRKRKKKVSSCDKGQINIENSNINATSTATIYSEVVTDKSINLYNIKTENTKAILVPENQNGDGIRTNSENDALDEDILIIDDSSGVDSDSMQILDMCSDFQVLNSDSDADLGNLDDVGHDLSLINCSSASLKVNSSKSEPSIVEDVPVNEKNKYCGVNFDVDELKKLMSADPNKWKILPSDEYNLNSLLPKGPRCKKCRQLGHQAIKCSNKIGPQRCSLCGIAGHQEPRCPNKICTQCGTENAYSTNMCGYCVRFRKRQCKICKMFGHLDEMCPDLWRRYHLTTEEGPIVKPTSPLGKPKSKFWCSGCAREGHAEHMCSSYNRKYLPIDPFIHSYEDVYGMNCQHGYSHQRVQRIVSQPNVESYPNNFIIQVPNSKNINGNTSVIINPCDVVVGNEEQVQDMQQMDTQTEMPGIDNTNEAIDSHRFISFDGQERQNNPANVNVVFNDYLENRQIKASNYVKIFMNSSPKIIHTFLLSEIRKLDEMCYNVIHLRKRLWVLEKVGKNTVSLNLHYKKLNMVIFGIYKFQNGKRNVDYLRNFLYTTPKSNVSKDKRNLLLQAYKYIFAPYKHEGVDYHRFLQLIILRFDTKNH